MIRAVVVDDEPNTESILRYFIDKGDLPIEIAGTANNGRTAVDVIKRVKPDVVFLDIRMPIMNGFGVMDEAPDAKYIVVTAYDTFEYAQKALRLGAVDILLKPVDLEQVITAVGRATGWTLTDNRVVNEIERYIYQHYAEPITLTQLSEQFFLTQSHISRLFKKHMGETVVDYINRVRIEHARKLLEDGVSVKEAAERVGYNTLNNFYKCFKKITGTTPAMYNKKKNGTEEDADQR